MACVCVWLYASLSCPGHSALLLWNGKDCYFCYITAGGTKKPLHIFKDMLVPLYYQCRGIKTHEIHPLDRENRKVWQKRHFLLFPTQCHSLFSCTGLLWQLNMIETWARTPTDILVRLTNWLSLYFNLSWNRHRKDSNYIWPFMRSPDGTVYWTT